MCNDKSFDTAVITNYILELLVEWTCSFACHSFTVTQKVTVFDTKGEQLQMDHSLISIGILYFLSSHSNWILSFLMGI